MYGRSTAAPQTPSRKNLSLSFLFLKNQRKEKAYRPVTTISKTSLTFSTNPLGVNGFCKNATPRSNVPFSAITLYVYPDIYSTRTEGCRAKTLFANSRPLTPGMITSVSNK